MSPVPRYYTPLLWLLLALFIACFWLPLLSESFWLDETVTAFILRHGSTHPSLSAAPRLDQTIYYWLPRASQSLLGFSEFSLRLPSLLVTLVGLLLIYRIAVRLIHPLAGWLTVFFCFIPHQFTAQATDARPYGLGTTVALAAMWFLIRWLDHAKWLDAVLFALCAALLVRVHLIYWPFYAVFSAYALVRFRRSETPVSGRALAVVWIAVLTLLVPLIPVTLDLLHNEAAHVVIDQPGWKTIFTGFWIPVVAAGAAAALLLARLCRWERVRGPGPVSRLVLIAMWWLWQPAFLLASSLVTGNAVFLPRYFSLAIPGMALAGALAIGVFIPDRFWRPAAIVLAGGLAAMHFVKEFPPSRHSHWREAAAEVGKLTRGSITPVLCPSPFVEARSPVWTPQYALPGFLFAHLDAYPIREIPALLPSAVEPEGKRYARTVLIEKIVPAGRFVLYGGGYGVNHWAAWLTEQPELDDWEHRLVGVFGDVEVVLFRKRRH